MIGLRARRREPPPPAWDPGRELRAERRARELLRSVVPARDYEMYLQLGFVSVEGSEGSGYAYLIYPHRPLIAYDTATGGLLCEYCVGFPDHSEAALGERLPPADDVLAKWISVRSRERELVATANMNLPGRQVDPAQVRRDLICMREWLGARRYVD